MIAPATIPAPNVWHNGRAGRVVPPLFDDFEAAMDRPRLVLAALLFCPTIADRHLHRIDADFWSGAVQRALAAIALRQYRDDGEPDYIHAGIDAGDIGHDRRAVAAELELLADFAVIVRADNFIGDLAVLESRLADERFGDAFNEAALDLEHGAPIAAARMRITDALAAAQPPGPAVLTLADAMAADDGTHRELIRTGLAFVDDRFPGSGLCRGDKVGIASIPGGGKSAMALHVSLSALIYNPEMRCVWALGEMSTATLASRALTVLSRVPEGIRRDGRMTADEAERVRQAENALEELASRIHIVRPVLTPSAIDAAVRASGAALLIVDYLQLVAADGENQTRRDVVDSVIRALTATAATHNVASFWLSSMPKGAVRSSDPYASFKESSELLHAADLAFVLDWPEESEVNPNRPDAVHVKARCVKARHGSPQTIPLVFDRAMQRFALEGSTC